jgi:transcriptional regulator NrdR family protein
MKNEGGSCKNCIVKRKGHTEEFDERKVYGSVYAACASAHYDEEECERTADELTKRIKKFIGNKKEIRSAEIRGKIENELKKKDEELAFYYEQHLPNLKNL